MVKRYKGVKAKADVLFSKVIRSQELCEAEHVPKRNGSSGCSGRWEAAHIISRRFNSVRTDTRNSYCLCSAHHFYFHQYPREFSHFISGTWAQQYYDQLRQKSYSAKKVDWEERVDFLKRIEAGEITIAEARCLEDV